MQISRNEHAINSAPIARVFGVIRLRDVLCPLFQKKGQGGSGSKSGRFAAEIPAGPSSQTGLLGNRALVPLRCLLCGARLGKHATCTFALTRPKGVLRPVSSDNIRLDTFFPQIAQELNIQPQQVKAAADLLEEGGTVPFIARYRKEATGSLDEVAIVGHPRPSAPAP